MVWNVLRRDNGGHYVFPERRNQRDPTLLYHRDDRFVNVPGVVVGVSSGNGSNAYAHTADAA